MNSKTWTIKDLLNVTTDYLKSKEIDNSRVCAEILLAHQLKISRVSLYLAFDQPLNDEEISGYRSLIRRRVNREPVQYLTGFQEFWSMEFIVTPEVLIPRPESELLVEQVKSLYQESASCEKPCPLILDLGTGSGALAVSLAREFEEASIWASDISQEAIDLAIMNADKHGVNNRIRFIQGDLWKPFVDKSFLFDIILSNPPYVPSEDYESLPPEVRDYEPRLALDGREGGMFYIEKIIMEGAEYLNPGGWLLMEMDPIQTTKALRIVEDYPCYGEKRRVMDYSHNYRVVMTQKKQEE